MKQLAGIRGLFYGKEERGADSEVRIEGELGADTVALRKRLQVLTGMSCNDSSPDQLDQFEEPQNL